MPDFSLTKIRSSPNWYIQWFEDGHSKRASTRTADRGDAESILAAFRLVQGEQPAQDLSITRALEWYWEDHGKQLMRPDSAALSIRYLTPFFGATPASALTLSKQKAYVEYRRGAGAGDESIRRDLSVLSAALRRAEKHNKIDRAPPMMSLTPNGPRERWMTRKEVAALFRSMRNRRGRHLLLFSRLALYTGARTGAILDLTWDRVHFDTGLIDYRKPGRRTTKKRRVVSPMGPVLKRALLHAQRHARTGRVIEWGGGGVAFIRHGFRRHAERAGLAGVSAHVLRHTFASWAVRKGVPIYSVGKALGQTVASTTERYAKLAPDDIAAVMEAVRRK